MKKFNMFLAGWLIGVGLATGDKASLLIGVINLIAGIV
jgi:hypothetical protein